MANGKAHEKINLFFLALGIAIVMTIVNLSWAFNGIFVILGYVWGTYYFGPDLDLKSRPYRRWGVFKFIWVPYQAFNHRSVWTHGYVISDIIRYAYILVWYILFACVVDHFLGQTIIDTIRSIQFFLSEYKTYFLSLLLGNILSSTAHTLTDKTTSGLKRMF